MAKKENWEAKFEVYKLGISEINAVLSQLEEEWQAKENEYREQLSQISDQNSKEYKRINSDRKKAEKEYTDKRKVHMEVKEKYDIIKRNEARILKLKENRDAYQELLDECLAKKAENERKLEERKRLADEAKALEEQLSELKYAEEHLNYALRNPDISEERKAEIAILRKKNIEEQNLNHAAFVKNQKAMSEHLNDPIEEVAEEDIEFLKVGIEKCNLTCEMLLEGRSMGEIHEALSVKGLVKEVKQDRPLQKKQEEPTQEEPVQEEPVQEEPVQEEPVQEEPTQEEPVQEEPTQEEPVQEEPAQEEPDSTSEVDKSLEEFNKVLEGFANFYNSQQHPHSIPTEEELDEWIVNDVLGDEEDEMEEPWLLEPEPDPEPKSQPKFKQKTTIEEDKTAEEYDKRNVYVKFNAEQGTYTLFIDGKEAIDSETNEPYVESVFSIYDSKEYQDFTHIFRNNYALTEEELENIDLVAAYMLRKADKEFGKGDRRLKNYVESISDRNKFSKNTHIDYQLKGIFKGKYSAELSEQILKNANYHAENGFGTTQKDYLTKFLEKHNIIRKIYQTIVLSRNKGNIRQIGEGEQEEKEEKNTPKETEQKDEKKSFKERMKFIEKVKNKRTVKKAKTKYAVIESIKNGFKNGVRKAKEVADKKRSEPSKTEQSKSVNVSAPSRNNSNVIDVEYEDVR